MDTQRLELMEVLYRGLTQLGYSRASLQHEELVLNIMQRAVADPAYIESLRADSYSVLRESELSDIEKDTIQFMVT